MDTSKLVGYFRHSPSLSQVLGAGDKPIVNWHFIEGRTVFEIPGFISAEGASALLAEVNDHPQVPVGRDGYVKNYQAGSPVYSRRSTLFSDEIAVIFYRRIAGLIPVQRNPYVPGAPLFGAIAVNPSMRLIDYPPKGWLVPHYDGSYRASDDEMSLYSLVIFLTSNPDDGGTRFIREYRQGDDSDWQRPARDDEVIQGFNPQAGAALLFPHDLLHEGQLTSARKVILRTDVMFRSA